jgi:hypothetical protein
VTLSIFKNLKTTGERYVMVIPIAIYVMTLHGTSTETLIFVLGSLGSRFLM